MPEDIFSNNHRSPLSGPQGHDSTLFKGKINWMCFFFLDNFLILHLHFSHRFSFPFILAPTTKDQGRKVGREA